MAEYIIIGHKYPQYVWICNNRQDSEYVSYKKKVQGQSTS